MSRRGLDDHGAIAEHIMILAVQQNRFAVGEALEKFWVRHTTSCRPRGEDRVAVPLLHDPGGTGDHVANASLFAGSTWIVQKGDRRTGWRWRRDRHGSGKAPCK